MNFFISDKPPAKTRVVVAMSGGVDSSTVAALLKERGYDVVGVTLQLYDFGAATASASKTCCAGRDILDARRVADALAIPHYVLDYESRFRAEVMEPFADSYLAGETPIPCVACNRTVKFRDLLATARDLGADALVTGHYVRRVESEQGSELHAGADPARDQSYFLFATTRAQLDMLRFPLGDMSKDETRALAARLGVPVAAKPDSQDICFVPGGDYARVVERLRPGRTAAAGDIVDLDGRVLGRHRGVFHFTVGQRRGLDLGNAGAGEPLYVVRIEAATARVVVGPRAALLKDSLTARDVNWLDAPPEQPSPVTVKVRSTQPAAPATVRALPDGRAEVAFAEPQGAIAPGQACVFYRGSRVLGGGWIERDARPKGLPASAKACF
ncbi:MAG: tRNA 2-thiouridine(34) synthase MnmA [Rhodospirillales bacterium]|nr:tRNA 2-thiouridine(34) synthase MnmA [Rhodospirillales bacterium]